LPLTAIFPTPEFCRHSTQATVAAFFGWMTRKNAKGDTEWIPPPHLDRGQPRVNTFHHPEKVLAEDDEEVA